MECSNHLLILGLVAANSVVLSLVKRKSSEFYTASRGSLVPPKNHAGTVFLNMCPLFALFIEPLVLPSRVENVLNQTFSSKMALITMAFGAVLFSLQYPDFTANGLRSAGLLVALVLPYRLLQRMLLAEPWRWGNPPLRNEMRVGCLMMGYDGIIMDSGLSQCHQCIIHYYPLPFLLQLASWMLN